MAPDPLYLATAVEAALAAGRTQLKYFRSGVSVEKKGPIDLVTAADVEVEREFRRLIAARFPTHGVLGEEATSGSTTATSRFRWIIDPVDGTTNFAHGLACFCCSIALEIDGRVEVAAVYDPIATELFTAERGMGARLNGSVLRVSAIADLIDALLCTGFPYSVREERRDQVELFATFLGRAQGIRRLGSAALDLCYLAAGRFDGFWEKRLHAWDVAAAMLIVEEAGGKLTNYGGEPFDMFNGQVIASNGALHGAMLDAVREASRAS